MPIALIRSKFITLNPENILEMRKIEIQPVTTIGMMPRMKTLTEKYAAKEIRVIILTTIRGVLGTKTIMPIPIQTHNASGRIRC